MLGSAIEDDASDRLIEGARADIERALALQPDLPEALAARGLYHTCASTDPERALEDLPRALSIAPNDADTHGIAGMTLRRFGRFDEALVHSERAESLAPGRSGWGGWAAHTLTQLGHYHGADRALRAMVQRYPIRPNPRLNRYLVRFMATGDTTGWREEPDRLLLARPGQSSLGHLTYWMLTFTGDLAGLIALYERAPEGDWSTSEPRDYLLGVTHTAAGDAETARPYLAAVASAPCAPDDAYAHVHAAVALELLGQHAEALRAADEAVQLALEDRDAVNAPQVAMLRADARLQQIIRDRIPRPRNYESRDRSAVSRYGECPGTHLFAGRRAATDPRIVLRSPQPKFRRSVRALETVTIAPCDRGCVSV